MTVRELIAVLKQFDGDMDICISHKYVSIADIKITSYNDIDEDGSHDHYLELSYNCED